jgi:hypothetical protein
LQLHGTRPQGRAKEDADNYTTLGTSPAGRRSEVGDRLAGGKKRAYLCGQGTEGEKGQVTGAGRSLETTSLALAPGSHLPLGSDSPTSWPLTDAVSSLL